MIAGAERQLLETRARALARPLESGALAPGAPLNLVVFRLAGERLALDASLVLEALPLESPVPIPGGRAWLLGVVGHRGRVIGVFDLRGLLIPDGSRHRPLTQMIVVAAEGQTFALAVERVEETRHATADQLAPAPHGPFLGVTAEPLTVLDLEAVATDPRLRVDDSE